MQSGAHYGAGSEGLSIGGVERTDSSPIKANATAAPRQSAATALAQLYFWNAKQITPMAMEARKISPVTLTLPSRSVACTIHTGPQFCR